MSKKNNVINIKDKIKKIDFKWIVTTIIAIIVLTLSITNKSSIRDWFGRINIDFIKIFPYQLTGNCIDNKNNFLDAVEFYCRETNTQTNIYDKACGIRTYFKNSKASTYRISDIYIDIEEIKPIINYNIDISAILIDDCVYIYAINQGLEDVNNIEITLNAYNFDNSGNKNTLYINKYFDFNNCASSVNIDSIHGGEIIKLFTLHLNDDGINLCKQNVWILLKACVYSKDLDQSYELGSLFYSDYEERVLLTKSEGDNDIIPTFILFIDMNKGKGKYQIPMQINPNIENDYNVGVDIIIIPNQSCDIKFSLIYMIGSDTIRTETISTKISVPIYKDDYGYYDSLLTYCVNNHIDNYKIGTQPYIEYNLKYDIYSILEEME